MLAQGSPPTAADEERFLVIEEPILEQDSSCRPLLQIKREQGSGKTDAGTGEPWIARRAHGNQTLARRAP
jgi:hypothetical protein